MIRIAVSQAAFEAIAATLPLGSVAYEAQCGAQGQQLIWLEARVLANSPRCAAMARATPT